MSIKSGYKQTEIGIIPEDWELVKLPEITKKITSGGTPSRSKAEYYENGTVNWIKTGELKDCYIYNSEEKITEEAVINSSAKIFPVDTLLIAMYGATIGKTAYLKVESSTNQACCAIIFNTEKANTHFYWQYFLFTKENLISKGCGAGQPNISQGIIKDISIPFPPLEEQKRIADILSTVDKKIAFVEENINATEELKKGLMQKLLTEGIGHTEFKDSELGRIPESWEIDTISSISKNFDGMRVPIKSEERNERKGIYPYYGAQGIIDYIDNYIFNGTYLLVAEDGENVRSQKYNIAFVVTGKFWVNNHAHILQTNINIDINYIASVLNYMDITKYVTGTGQPKLNKAQLQSIKLLIPPFEEQKQIAEILSTIDNKLENLKEKKQSFEELKKGLMQKLLTGEVRV